LRVVRDVVRCDRRDPAVPPAPADLLIGDDPVPVVATDEDTGPLRPDAGAIAADTETAAALFISACPQTLQ
jgi:hypothetical protein